MSIMSAINFQSYMNIHYPELCDDNYVRFSIVHTIIGVDTLYNHPNPYQHMVNMLNQIDRSVIEFYLL